MLENGSRYSTKNISYREKFDLKYRPTYWMLQRISQKKSGDLDKSSSEYTPLTSRTLVTMIREKKSIMFL